MRNECSWLFMFDVMHDFEIENSFLKNFFIQCDIWLRSLLWKMLSKWFIYSDFKLKTMVNPLVQYFELFQREEKKNSLSLKIGVLHHAFRVACLRVLLQQCNFELLWRTLEGADITHGAFRPVSCVSFLVSWCFV